MDIPFQKEARRDAENQTDGIDTLVARCRSLQPIVDLSYQVYTILYYCCSGILNGQTTSNSFGDMQPEKVVQLTDIRLYTVV